MNKKTKRRGQALVETTMVLPVLVMMMLGAADFGRGFYLKLEMSGASRAGMRTAVLGPSVDIGNAIRTEPNPGIPNNATAWGAEGPAQADADCTSASQHCGDTGPCPPADFGSGQLACFAIRTCLNWSGGSCSSWSAWGVRPAANSDQAVDVWVVYKFVPATPFISNFSGGTGALYLAVDTLGLQLY